MKKSLLFLFLACYGSNLQAQNNNIKLDLLAVIASREISRLNISYERKLNNYFTACLGFESGHFSIGTFKPSGSNIQSTVYVLKGIGLRPEVRLYPFASKNPAPEGFFIGTHFTYRWYNELYSYDKIEIKTSGRGYTYGGNMGYKWKVNFFVFEGLLGMGKADGSWKTPNDRGAIPGFGVNNLSSPFIFALRIEGSIGVSF